VSRENTRESCAQTVRLQSPDDRILSKQTNKHKQYSVWLQWWGLLLTPHQREILPVIPTKFACKFRRFFIKTRNLEAISQYNTLKMNHSLYPNWTRYPETILRAQEGIQESRQQGVKDTGGGRMRPHTLGKITKYA